MADRNAHLLDDTLHPQAEYLRAIYEVLLRIEAKLDAPKAANTAPKTTKRRRKAG